MKIAVDGPSASGKSTLAKKISLHLGIPYLETGLLYRTFAYISLKEGTTSLPELFSREPQVILSVGKTLVKVGGEQVKEEMLRSEEVGKRASELGAIPEFRERINAFFRKLIGDRQVVVEGRDAGTHIIPEAPVKLFITASPEERARRRYQQLLSMGIKTTYEEVLRQITERDRRDAERPLYPFRPAPDAVIIDTTGKSPEEVLREALRIINERAQRP
ncbi:MAG: (d)CMP kinase [Aquificae bacterium]|nr:(d)CMP kinase [Aquificota bacterium]